MNITNTPKERLYFLVAGYFRFWANISLRRWKPTVLALTGSTGKTTLLQILETQLGTDAHFSHNANSIYGIAYDILGMNGVHRSRIEWLRLIASAPWRALTYTRREKYYIVEIDGGRPGGAAMIAQWLKPKITALIGVEESHAAYYDQVVAEGKYSTHLEAILDEFMSIPRNTTDTVVIDGSNDLITEAVKQQKDRLPQTIIAIDEASFLKKYTVSLKGTMYECISGTYEFSYPMPREVWLQLAMTEAILKSLDLPIATHDLRAMQLPPGRSTVFAGKKDLSIIDSSYNAQLGSMIATLNMFASIEIPNKWAVLGDLIELGGSETSQHQSLGEFLKDYKADKIILVGRRLKRDTAPMLTGHENVIICTDAHSALEYLQKNLAGGETVLFKGSQHLEWIIARFLLNSEDVKRLPRQTPADFARLKKMGYE